LSALDGWVTQQIAGTDTPRGDVQFTRRTVRAHLGLSDTQLRVHLDRLVQLEYVLPHAGKQGQLYSYSLRFDGDAEASGPQLAGLGVTETEESEPTSRGVEPTSRGSTGNFAGGSRGLRGGIAAPSRGAATTRKPKQDKASSVPAAVIAAKPRSRKLNGHAHGEH
jgi:hypothetical protein